jgi:hypothetical protein
MIVAPPPLAGIQTAGARRSCRKFKGARQGSGRRCVRRVSHGDAKVFDP